MKKCDLELCKGVHCVDLGETFRTHIYLENLASRQPRTSPLKFAASRAHNVRREGGSRTDLLERLLREDVDLLGLHGLPLAEVHLAAPRVGPSLKTSLQTFRMHVLLINFNLN